MFVCPVFCQATASSCGGAIIHFQVPGYMIPDRPQLTEWCDRRGSTNTVLVCQRRPEEEVQAEIHAIQ